MPTNGVCDMPASPLSQRALPRCFPAPPSRKEKRTLCASWPEAVPPPRRRVSPPRLSRTPSFSWTPVRGAARYEFQLAKSPDFDESSIVCTRPPLKSPAVTIPMALPWMSGDPYAAYGRARARTAGGPRPGRSRSASTSWWDTLPEAIVSSQPGLARWASGGRAPRATTVVHGYRPRSSRRGRTPSTSASSTVPSRAGLHRSRALACSRSQDDVRHDPLQLAARHVRPVEQGEHVQEPECQLRAAEARLRSFGRWHRGAHPCAARVHRLTPAFTFSGDQVGGTSLRPCSAPTSSAKPVRQRRLPRAITGGPSYAPRTMACRASSKAPPTCSRRKTAGPSRRSGRQDVHGRHRKCADDRERQAGRCRSRACEGRERRSHPGSWSRPGAAVAPRADRRTRRPVDSGWPHGRFYWTVVPLGQGRETQSRRSSTGGGASGSLSITVASITGISKGSTLNIGSAAAPSRRSSNS